MTHKLFYDGSSVNSGIPIDSSQLKALAVELCEEGKLHPSRLSFEDAEKSFEDEKQDNGGYCNDCERIAGFILSLILRSVSHE
jgi:hypothetical protein